MIFAYFTETKDENGNNINMEIDIKEIYHHVNSKWFTSLFLRLKKLQCHSKWLKYIPIHLLFNKNMTKDNIIDYLT